MKISNMFVVREIMEMEDKAKSIKVLDDDNCVIIDKALNKNKIILHMKRASDDSTGNVFVYLKDEFHDKFLISKQLLASKAVVGLTLKQFKEFNIEKL